MPAAAGPTGWAHQATGFQSNGAVNVKSLVGGSYAGTQNPTGAIAKSNQNAATQAPTVIIQATGSNTQFAVTTSVINGNMGGVSGANAFCAAEFGAGWKIASFGKLINATTFVGIQAWVMQPTSSSTCNSYSSTVGSGSATSLLGFSSAAPAWGVVGVSCSGQLPVLCVNF